MVEKNSDTEIKKIENNTSVDSDEIDLMELIAVLWQGRKKIIYITSAFTIIGILYAFLATPWYEATVKIMPGSKSGSSMLGQYAGLAAMAGISLPSSGGNEQLYPEIIKSNFVLDRVLEHKFQTATYEKPVTLFDFWETELDSSEKDWQHVLFENSKRTLRDNYIDISVDKMTNLLTMKVSAPDDPVLAASLANFMAEQLDLYNRKFRKNKASEQRQFIEKSLYENKSKFTEAENNLRRFREENRDLGSPDKQLLHERLQTELEVQRNLYIELTKQLEIAKIEEFKEMETVDILEKAEVPVYRIKPKRKLLVLMMFVLGAISSIFYVFGLRLWDSNYNKFWKIYV